MRRISLTDEFMVHCVVVVAIIMLFSYALSQKNEMLAYMLTCSLLIDFGLIILRWNYLRPQHQAVDPLAEPLVITSDEQSTQLHRIDATAKDAEEGFNRCTVCAFENFRRMRFCSLCGEKISDADIDTSHCIDSVPSRRQMRARKRREWVRKQDVDGRLFWYRQALERPRECRSQTVAIPSYTIMFQWEETDQEESTKSVVDSVKTLTFTLEESHQTNAAQISIIAELEPRQFADVLRLAAMDFPSRYSHFVVNTATSLVPAEMEYLKLSVHRDYVLEESISHLSCVKLKNIHSIMRINFIDEHGVDAGGLHREWFMLLNDKLTNKQTGLFRCTNKSDQSYYLNPNSRVENGDEHLVYFYAVGRLVGRALLEGTVLNFHFAVPLLKIILGIPVSFDDLEYLDEEAYRSLVWLLEHDHVEELGLDFSVCEVMEPHDVEGVQRVEVVDLIPDGRNVAVTDANKFEFVKRKFEFMVFESVSSQLYVFLRGVYEIIPLELLMLFDHEELDYILYGDHEIDVDEWQKHTRVSPGLKNSPTLKWFWEVVREMPKEYHSRLLQFATGSSHLPPSGFDGLTCYDGRLCPFTLQGKTDSNCSYIHAHACFNRIDLPYFRSKDELKRVLLLILETEAYGFTET